MTKQQKKPLAKMRSANAERRYKARQKRLRRVGARPLLELLPDELLEKYSRASEVDTQVKHLWGRLLVLLMIYAIINDRDDSLHSLSDVYNSQAFRVFSGKGGHKTWHSSLASRFKTIKVKYFEDLYAGFLAEVQRKYGKRLNKDCGHLARFDSTMVALSAALTQIGMRVGAKPKKGEGKVQVKFTIGLQGLLPTHVKVFCDQGHLSEEKALKAAIEGAELDKNDVAVFDMGLKSRKTFQKFDQSGRLFVTRLKDPRYDKIRVYKNIKGRTSDNLEFHSDLIVHLYESGGDTVLQVPFRLVVAQVRSGENAGKMLYFLTNILDMSATQVAQIYLRRWDIEVFFRFLKQEIGLRSLLSFNENGIKAVLYLRLLSATMLRLYMWLNHRKDYKGSKFALQDDLFFEISRAWAPFIVQSDADKEHLSPDYQGIIPL